MVFQRLRFLTAGLLFCFTAHVQAADTFRVATYNVENYLEVSNGSRPAKSEAAKAKVRESVIALKPDVIALEEMGGTNALLELQGSLKTDGLDLPYSELVSGADTNINVALLSRFPIVARRPQTNDFFLLNGRRWQVSRGFLEVGIKVNEHYSFALIAVHLKSKVPIPQVDEADLRLEEAKVLREKIDALLRPNPNSNLIVLGDFNDTHDSRTIKTILGRGNEAVYDTRPAERDGQQDGAGDGARASRSVTWTEFYAKQDVYTRMDYIFLSRGMAREWDAAGTYILSRPDWGLASDHRPLVATFVAEEK
ncbi:MAG TPA: endonuclease/exonuclease/phosphatase family protein [Verrucomicrobiae bacterium]|nr:endonuclease/exonuclease/phosphatase family protein [Verrucomicrobiae bacterium]